MHPRVDRSTIYNSPHTETTEMSTDRWMGKEAVAHIHKGILLSQKKKEIMPFAITWMDLEIIILSEISQTETDKYHDITYR